MLLIAEGLCDCRRFGAEYLLSRPTNGVDVQDSCWTYYINYLVGHPIMPKGLKDTSSLISIGFNVTESAANTFTQERVDLQLNPLDNEVFVVYAVDMDISAPDAVAGLNTDVFSSLSTTTRTSVGNLSNSNVITTAANQIRGGIADGVGFSYMSADAPATQLEYLAIIATNDFFIQIVGANNLAAKGMSGRLYGVRAKADASVYAALVQSEVLTS
jgi:hypothetical protein